ncbi:MAG TPA: tRNA pseudouridine(38-40) synthase TruA [Gammaproteobacteria bacterium]|nr:tRNA pseudouridine(38-40) synthase TruA [Gammaproteobacteria bacterium]
MRLALIIEYEGTDYHGFQYQENAASIQEQIEKSIHALTGERLRVKAAGRTDAGVHALGQVVAFDTESKHPPETFLNAMNFHLPDDIVVKAAYRTGPAFDPRRHAISRRYRYTLVNSVTRSPTRRLTTSRIRENLETGLMSRGAILMEGIHDFARFAGPLERLGASTVREIFSASVEENKDEVIFEVEGSAFLPHQVRRMAGALVDLGRGFLSIEQLNQMIEGVGNGVASRSLPPRGLCLIEVKYANFPPKGGEKIGN